MTSTRKIKYGSTSSYNKICNEMNATNIFIHIINSLNFYFLVKIRVLHILNHFRIYFMDSKFEKTN
jgi:hypothetical protein